MQRFRDFLNIGVSPNPFDPESDVTADMERDLAVLRKLCGDEALKNVVIVTAMWPGAGPEIRDAYELELRKSDLWKAVQDGGATMVLHDGSLASAQTIVRRVIDNPPLTLHIQREFTKVCKDIMRMIAEDESEGSSEVQVEELYRHIIQTRRAV